MMPTRIHEEVRMLNWPVRCAVVAVVLQCVACTDANASPYLVTESAFIERDGISSQNADPLFESSARFSQALAKMREDEKKSIEAQDLTRHYRSALERAVGTQGVVEDLTCGLSLCMGAVSAGSHADHDAWAERLYQDPGAVRHVILGTIERDGDRFESRFLFSADSAIKAIILPPKRDTAQPALAKNQPADALSSGSYLSTESVFIEQDSLSSGRSDEVLKDPALFSKALMNMRGDEITRQDAQNLALHHRSVLERAVGSEGLVEDLTCGLSLCMGLVTSASRADHDAWSARLAKDPAARRYGAVHRIEPVGDQFQNRFVFSADPAVASVIMDR